MYIMHTDATGEWVNFAIMRAKINQQNAQINSGLIYYWSITPSCFGPSVEAIIREFKILPSKHSTVITSRHEHIYITTF